MNNIEFDAELRSFPTINEQVLFAQSILESKECKSVRKAAEAFLDFNKDYIVSLLQGIKDGDEDCFHDLLEIKDVGNFIHHYAYYIDKYHHFHFERIEIVNEIKLQIFYHIKQNYRLYNVPNELSLLLMSMRSWIRQKVSKKMVESNFPMKHEPFQEHFVGANYGDYSNIDIEEIIEECLDEEEKEILNLRFFNDLKLVDVGKRLNKSKDTIQRKYYQSLEKIKTYLQEQDY